MSEHSGPGPEQIADYAERFHAEGTEVRYWVKANGERYKTVVSQCWPMADLAKWSYPKAVAFDMDPLTPGEARGGLTPAMLEAGVSAYCRIDPIYQTDAEMVADIWRAMEKARLVPDPFSPSESGPADPLEASVGTVAEIGSLREEIQRRIEEVVGRYERARSESRKRALIEKMQRFAGQMEILDLLLEPDAP